MGVTRHAPWWLTWLLTGGLIAIFIGERVLGAAGPARTVLSGVGALIVLGCLLWRLLSWRSSIGEERRVERLFLLTYAGCVLALLGYVLSSEWAINWLGLDFVDDTRRDRYETILQVLWPILLTVSLLPALAAELVVGAHRQARAGATRIESLRVTETATGGLTVALAGALLFVLGFIVTEHDKTLDVSYFRTATPGSATEGMVASLDERLDVRLFFPTVNPVKDEVLRYFRSLSDATGRLRIEEHDRLAAPDIAEEFSVTTDGTIVLAQGDRTERLVIGSTLDEARPTLRRFDQEMQSVLFPLLRERRTVYLTTGHGELNDPESAGPLVGTPLGEVNVLQEILGFLNYDVRDLGAANGLVSDVPPDAALVLVLGPSRPFLDAELVVLDRYLDRGGALLLALDPESEAELDSLEQRLGVEYVPVPLADDQRYVTQRGDLTDRRLIITDRFSSHEAAATVSTAGLGAGILLVGPGYLETLEGSEDPALTLVRSLPSTFNDLDRDYEFDEGTEERRSFDLVAAVEQAAANPLPSATTAGADSVPTMRALVFPSSAMFSDAVLASLGLNAALVADGIRWLGGEEAFIGSTQTEEDIPIVHTRAEDVAWFYGTILGAPSLVLALGLMGVYHHRRRGRSR